MSSANQPSSLSPNGPSAPRWPTREAVYAAPIDSPPDPQDVDAVLAVGRAFYAAFEAGDLDAMSEVWEHSDRVVCTHPGWPVLRGWGAVSGSWFAIFRAPGALQVILTNENVEVAGDTAWVAVDENLIGERIGGTVSAVNVFVRAGAGWKMVVHHGSAVAASQPQNQS